MRDERTQLISESGFGLPTFEETNAFLRRRTKPTVAQVLRAADSNGKLLFQPRCGVGGHGAMVQLLQDIETIARPDILSVTIDSYTRLKQFQRGGEVLRKDPSQLNGYPLVNHGWMKGRALEESVAAPLEIRHGSPDARLLFETAIASGITSFEGGGICYNLPYAKDVPILDSLKAWDYVDRVTGELAKEGILVDRELFGTLSAVLVPPSISLALTLLEAVLATKAGVKCLSIAYPQGGNLIQDMAALRAIRSIARDYLPKDVEVFPVLHEFMGAFPRDRVEADSLIFYGALTAKLGRATKLITKTNKEAFGIPNAMQNAEGILIAKVAAFPMLDFIKLEEGRVEEEAYWIRREVEELVDPVLAQPNLMEAIAEAFRQGKLDMPFSTSRHAKSEVIPARDTKGAVRYLNPGRLPFSEKTKKRHARLMWASSGDGDSIERVFRDIQYFSSAFYRQKPAYVAGE